MQATLNLKSFLTNSCLFGTQCRHMAIRRANWPNEGIQYPGFKYYPKNAGDFKEPPCEPSKLFRVHRRKPLKGVPFYEKKLLAEFGLDKKASDVAIVKNLPENNQRLWKIKHLIEIQPITFPDGFPDDPNGASLHENGELRIIASVKQAGNDARLKSANDFCNKPEKLDGDTLRRQSRRQWMSGWDVVY